MSHFTMRAGRALAVLAALSLTVASCGSEEPAAGGGDTTAQPASGAGEVGFSESFLTDAFQVQLVKQLGVEAEKQGVNLLPAANADGDPAKQNADITTLLNRGVKGLIVVPVDSKAIVPAIQRANQKGVPVVSVDLGADSGSISMVVRADNVYMGRAACEYMGEKLGGKGTVLDLQGDLATQNGQDRTKGFTDCMAEKFPDIKVISKPMNWKAEECTTQTQTVLSTQKIDGIFMGSESVCLAGVQKVLKDQGKLTTIDDPNHIVSVGIDGSKAALDAVRAKTLDAVISQPLDLYAKYGIQYIKEAMEGKTWQPGPTDHNSNIVKVGETLQDQLPSPTVTLENVDDPALWGNG